MTQIVPRARVLMFLMALGGAVSLDASLRAASADARPVVILGGGLSHEQLVTLSVSLSASKHPGAFLLDSARSSPYHKLFLSAYRPERVLPVGAFPDGEADLEKRLGIDVAPVTHWTTGPPVELWRRLFTEAERVVVCPAQPYPQLLQSACLAATLQAPLYVTHGQTHEAAELGRLLQGWRTRTVYGVGSAAPLCKQLTGVKVYRLADEQAVAERRLQHLARKGSIRTLVLANPADIQRPTSALSSLAPWVASQRGACVLLTNEAGSNVNALVRSAVARKELARVDNLILLADLQAIPMERRANPIPDGKDPYIEMEPLTPTGSEPFTFAVGRLFNEDPSVVPLVMARERLLETSTSATQRRALVVSNPHGGLPLLETFSRSTARELRNRGYKTTTRFGSEVSKEDLQQILPEQDIFLWEGHHSTLIRDYAVHDWNEPLQPSLVFLQSCLALKDYKAQPLIERGALCVVGSSTRIYSGSGGAFALSYFDALLYEQQSMGGSLRQAKNFLLAYSLLKEKRLGKDAKLSPANLRSAWAFTLWGDPTLKLPPPAIPDGALPPVRHHVKGNTIHLELPVEAHAKATSARFKAQMLPNGRLAGLISKQIEDDRQRLVPFVFAEVALPRAPEGKTPRLHGKLPSSRWVFCWDSRRRTGYLLVIPRTTDNDEIRFQVEWETPDRTIVRGQRPEYESE